MRRLIIILLWIGLSVPAIGQELNNFSKIKLLDGSEYSALIVENHPGDFIRIRISEGQLSTINYADIESIRGKNHRYQKQTSLEKGFFAESAYAFMFGKPGGEGDLRVGMSLGLTGNFRFNPYLSLGAGVEVNALYVNSNFLLIPVYGRISGSFADKRVAPYYMLDLGWSAASTSDGREPDFEMKGGIMLRPEVGVRINRVRIGIGYQNQRVSTSYTNNFWWRDEQLVEEHRVMRNIRMGVSVIF